MVEKVSRQGAKTPRAPRFKNDIDEDQAAAAVVDSAIAIHRDLGPGLLESVYEAILAHKLEQRGFKIQRQVPVPLNYEGVKFKEAFRADLIVGDKVIVEIKTVERLNNAHRKQLLTYLKLTSLKVGILLNFSEALMKNGITRIANAFDD
ncbi:MAG: GxxExxY protein [Wenzhouxiangella sp.]